VIVLDDVTRSYPGGVVALDHVSLTIEPGELLGIVGPSGSGKSTLLHIMGTLDLPTSGTVRIGGDDVTRLSDRKLSALRGRRIGFVFQQFHLTDRVSAVENMATGLLCAGVSSRERRAMAAEALERVGLSDRMKHRPHELSGGEKQRVAIARAVVNRPALILADEPTGALDSATGAAIMDLLRSLHADGATIAVITHDREIAATLPRRVSIRDGKIGRSW
jgi:putative ABC transport system ATP-binding protein